MNLEEILEEPNSRALCNKMVDWVGDNQQRFDELFEYVFRDPARIAAVAAWMSDYCVEKHPELIHQHVNRLVKALPSFKHQGVQRQMVRILARLPLPKKNLGILLNTCFDWMLDSNITVAVKVHCMQVLYHISLAEPDIKSELIAAIEEELPKNSIGFASRARKLLPKLRS